jgi:hypothetical protein
MNDESNAPSPGTAEYLEHLKRQYIESTISLAESFARKTAQHLRQGDQQEARKAWSNFASFCRSTLEMIQKLQDPETAKVFLEKLKLLDCYPEGSSPELQNHLCSN